jgi:hypothetical protein
MKLADMPNIFQVSTKQSLKVLLLNLNTQECKSLTGSALSTPCNVHRDDVPIDESTSKVHSTHVGSTECLNRRRRTQETRQKG